MRTDTARIPVIDGEVVTGQHRRASRWERITRSPFARDITAGIDRALQLIGLFGLAFAATIIARALGLLP